MELLALRELEAGSKSNSLFLKVEALGNVYSFSFAVGKDKSVMLSENVDAKFLSTKISGGFVGCMYALYATSLGKSSASTACFDWFESTGNDEVYR
jgi:alpha-N-arabinofuranosidase